MRRTTLLVAAAIAAALALPTFAREPHRQSRDGSFRFRLGGFFPSANSEFWDANESVFDQDRGDFNGGAIGASYVATLNNFLEFGLNLDLYDRSTTTSYRDFVDNFGDPIAHDARLSLVPLTFDLRVLPAGRWYRNDRGHRRPRRVVPYLGVGVGVNHWQYIEEGDFIAADDSIFYDRLRDSGIAMEGHALAGLELSFGRDWSLFFEGRYSRSDARPGGEFSTLDLGKLDLSGVSTFVGASVRFWASLQRATVAGPCR